MSGRTKLIVLSIVACNCIFAIPVFGIGVSKFGDFDDQKNVKVTLPDANGVLVTFSMSGGGYGEVTNNTAFSWIALYGTTGKSAFSITTPASQNISVGNITVYGPIKSIAAKTTNLQGNITVDSDLGSLMLNNVSGNRTITIGSSSNPNAGVLMKFNRISDLHIHSDMPIKTLTAVEWQDTDATIDDIIAPSIGTVNITGNKSLGLHGDFAPVMTITGTGMDPAKPVFGSGKIGGVLGIRGNTSTINGNLTSITTGQLQGDLSVIGNAKSIKNVQPMAILPPESGEIGVLDVTGIANVQGGKDKIKFTNDLLYSSEPDLYRLEDIRLYDVVGANWDYSGTYKISGIASYSGDGTGTVQVTDYYNSGDSNYYDISTSSGGVDITTTWSESADGIRLEAWGTGGGAGDFEMLLSSPLVAPKYLQLGKQYTDSAQFSGNMNIDSLYGSITGDITGTAKTSCKLIGHEQVTVDAGTFVAAKVVVGVTMSGTMIVDFEGYTFNGRYSASETQTWWGVPEVGVVKVITKMTVRVSVAGAGSASLTAKETDELTDYDTRP